MPHQCIRRSRFLPKTLAVFLHCLLLFELKPVLFYVPFVLFVSGNFLQKQQYMTFVFHLGDLKRVQMPTDLNNDARHLKSYQNISCHHQLKKHQKDFY